MAVAVQPNIAGLDDLETGLRTLKRSKLIVTPEFKDMMFAVERHHNDLKLAHLTGKAKDLVDQAQRDTKFYNILVKMLCEVKEKRTGEQRQGVRRVYTWYQANKHVLYSGPHFGRAQIKQEAKEILVKAATPRKQKPARSIRFAGYTHSSGPSPPPGQQKDRAQSAPAVRVRDHSATWRDSSFDWRKDLDKGLLTNDHPPKVEPLQLPRTADTDNDYEAELQGLGVEETEEDTAHTTEPLNTADTTTTTNSELIREARMLSRAHTGSPVLTPLGEQSPNIVASPVIPPKIVHPISHMVNPHATMVAQMEKEKQEKQLAKQKMAEIKSKADNLQAWQNFNKDFSHGQENVDRLNFVGRSGTPNDVRYFSHGQAEMPELYTPNVVTGYAQVMAEQSDTGHDEAANKEQKENVFNRGTLEEFYETAEAMYPGQPPPRPDSRARVMSAPMGGRRSSQQSLQLGSPDGFQPQGKPPAPHIHKLGHQLQDFAVKKEAMEVVEEQTTAIKLDTVYKAIDSVSEEMTMFKERLAPEAQQGFRQPTATGISTTATTIPTTTTTTSPSPGRMPSPSARTNSPVYLPGQASMRPASPARQSRPYSSPLLANRIINVGEGVDSPRTSARQRKDRCKSAGVVDWRGRVQPDSLRYKWGKTKFGGYTFVKKHMHKPINLRSAGSTSAGRRPKTAPISIRDKWKIERENENNPRVESQAASNSMTQIHQPDVDSMMNVQYLLGTSMSRTDSLCSLYNLDEDFLRSLRRTVQVPVEGQKEFVSFIAPSPAPPLTAEQKELVRELYRDNFDRPQTAIGIGLTRESGPHHHHPHHLGISPHPPPHQHLLPDFDDLHLPLVLDEDIAEDDGDDDSLAGDVGDQQEDELALYSGQDREEGEEGEQGEEEEPWRNNREEEEGEELLKEETREEEGEERAEGEEGREESLHSHQVENQAAELGQRLIQLAEDEVAEEIAELHRPTPTTPTVADEHHNPAKEATGGITEVASVAPSNPQSPAPSARRASQPLNFSQVWQFTPSKKDGKDVKAPKGFFVGPSASQWATAKAQPRQQVFSPRVVSKPPMASAETATFPKVERSAGRMPPQAHTVSSQMTMLARRHAELMRRVPPPRTPPSIPLAKGRPGAGGGRGVGGGAPGGASSKGRSPRSGPMLAELEHHARRERSPRAFMQHVKDLRSSGESVRDPSTAFAPSTDSLLGTLQVCRLNTPGLSRQHSLPSLFTHYGGSQDNLQSILKQPSDLHLYPENSTLRDIDERTGQSPDPEKTVQFSTAGVPLEPLHRPRSPLQPAKPMTAPAHLSNGVQRSGETLGFLRQVTSQRSSRTTSLHSSQSSGNTSQRDPPSTRNLARIGRPIAHYTSVPDPDELTEAVQMQKEAAAAVDIQRIFRGYVARNAYKKLMSSERMKMEDKQRAAMDIQRVYRGHVSRKRGIERRPLNPEMQEWANNYETKLGSNEQRRQMKVENRAEELSDNYHSHQSKMSVIGPHVNIYDIYHPKKTGPSKKELNQAAITMQRIVRGFLIRRRFDKLHRKAAWYGSTFPKMVKDYKLMLARIQRQHGVERPQCPFTTRDMNDYINTRKRYESVFDKKAFGGELEHGDLDSFFKECDLYPSQAEVEEAVRITMKDEGKSRRGQSLKRSEILEVVFYIYTPRAAGLENTRRSTWMNPIIDGVEARRLLGSEFVEEAPLEVCANLVIGVMRDQRETERAAEKAKKEAEAAALRERLGLRHPKDSDDEEDEEEERKRQKKVRKVTLMEPQKKE